MVNKLQLSIIVPIHNEEKYLDKVFRGILNQDLICGREIIAVLDACSDDSEKIARQYADRVLIVDFKKTSLTLNAGFAAAKNPILIVVGGNVVVPNNYLKDLSAAFNGVDMVCWAKNARGLCCLSKETLKKYGYLKPIFHEDWEYTRRIRNSGGTIRYLNGRYTYLKKTSLKRSFHYGVTDVYFVKVYEHSFKLIRRGLITDPRKHARFLGRLYGFFKFRNIAKKR